MSFILSFCLRCGCRLCLPLTVALDEVPKKIRVNKNIFLGTGVFYEEPNFVKRLVGRRKEPRRQEIWSSATVEATYGFGCRSFERSEKRQTKQRRRRYVASTVSGFAFGRIFGAQNFNLLLKFIRSTQLQVYTSARLTQNPC